MMNIKCIRDGFESKSEYFNKRRYNYSNGILSEKYRLVGCERDIIATKGLWSMPRGFGSPHYTPNPKHMTFQDSRPIQFTIRNWK